MRFFVALYFCTFSIGHVFATQSVKLKSEESIKSFCAPFKPDSDKCGILLNLEEIQRDCGQVCNTTIKPVGVGKYYDVIKKDFDCFSLFESDTIDSRDKETIAEVKKPLDYVQLPKRIRDLYTYQKRVQVREFYLDDAQAPANHPIWTVPMINGYRAMLRQGRPFSGYGTEAALEVYRHLRDHMSEVVEGGHVLVIGSQTPWIEAILLELGAGKITTVDYSPIENHHPQIETVTPEELAEQFMKPPGVQV